MVYISTLLGKCISHFLTYSYNFSVKGQPDLSCHLGVDVSEPYINL